MSFPISCNIIHLLYTNSQPGRHCICNFVDKQPTNTPTEMLCHLKGYIELPSSVDSFTFTQSPDIKRPYLHATLLIAVTEECKNKQRNKQK